jgi:beta-glucanase (GH16 family)
LILFQDECQTTNWKLIWQDEFSKDCKPDTSKWSFVGGNSDWNCYCFDDTSTTIVRNGKLYVSGILSKNSTDTSKYQIGCISTKNRFSFKYGKLEVRAKLAKGRGSSPAIWLLPESNERGCLKSGEIDVMEQLNYDTIFYQITHSYFIDVLKHKEDLTHSTTVHKVGEFNTFGME